MEDEEDKDGDAECDEDVTFCIARRQQMGGVRMERARLVAVPTRTR